MSPKIVDKERRRSELALAALEVIAAEGFEAASVSRIAELAGVSKGTVYLYYESKEAMTVAAARAWVEAVEARATPEIDGEGTAWERLRELLHLTTAAFLEDRRVVSLFLGVAQAALRDRHLLERLELTRRVSAPVRGAIARILREGIADGTLRADLSERVDAIALNIVASVDGLGLHHVADPGFFDLPTQLDLYLDGLLEGLGATPGSAEEAGE